MSAREGSRIMIEDRMLGVPLAAWSVVVVSVVE